MGVHNYTRLPCVISGHDVVIGYIPTCAGSFMATFSIDAVMTRLIRYVIKGKSHIFARYTCVTIFS